MPVFSSTMDALRSSAVLAAGFRNMTWRGRADTDRSDTTLQTKMYYSPSPRHHAADENVLQSTAQTSRCGEKGSTVDAQIPRSEIKGRYLLQLNDQTPHCGRKSTTVIRSDTALQRERCYSRSLRYLPRCGGNGATVDHSDTIAAEKKGATQSTLRYRG